MNNLVDKFSFAEHLTYPPAVVPSPRHFAAQDTSELSLAHLLFFSSFSQRIIKAMQTYRPRARRRPRTIFPRMRTYTPLWSEKWEKLFAEEGARGRQDYLDSLAAEEAMESLGRRFEAMSALLTPQATETEGVKALIHGAQEDIAAQKRANSTLTRRISTMYRTPRTSRLADKVFGMPELLEHILAFTSVPDLLRLYRVSKVFYNTIEGSPLLQRRLGLQANPSCHLDLPAEHLVSHVEGMDMNEVFYCGRMWDDNVELEPNAMPIKISVCTYSCRHKPGEQIQLRPLGERCKKMLITQPPIKEMGVYMQCCTPRYRPYRDQQTDPPMETLKSETGITTEQVWELVDKVQKAHRLCPNADSYDHDSEGFVQVRMTIEGSVVLKDDDPALVAKEKRKRESREEDEEFQSREVRFRPYIAAKRAARANGEPIPTFAEFQKRQVEQEAAEFQAREAGQEPAAARE